MRHRAQLAAVTAGPLVRVRGPFMIMIIIIGPLYRPLYSKMCVCVSVCETACLSVCPLQATGHRGSNHVRTSVVSDPEGDSERIITTVTLNLTRNN
jgi:hypothetical protein